MYSPNHRTVDWSYAKAQGMETNNKNKKCNITFLYFSSFLVENYLKYHKYSKFQQKMYFFLPFHSCATITTTFEPSILYFAFRMFCPDHKYKISLNFIFFFLHFIPSINIQKSFKFHFFSALFQ